MNYLAGATLCADNLWRYADGTVVGWTIKPRMVRIDDKGNESVISEQEILSRPKEN